MRSRIIALFVLGALIAAASYFASKFRAQASPNASSSPTVVWKAGSSTLGHWITANTYQCDSPNVSGDSFAFALTRRGQNCGRNQANPTVDANGVLVRLISGQQYTWNFDYVDGTRAGAPPGMGPDAYAASSIWQIHPTESANSPCASLNFTNGAGGTGAQTWSLMNCDGPVWYGAYKPGETDHWTIEVKISSSSSGSTKLYRNYALVASFDGPNYSGGTGDPWWNFGPYKWRWELERGGGSTMKAVNATINHMMLTSP